MSKARIISKFLIALSRIVENLTDEELEGLIKDEALGRILREPPARRSKPLGVPQSVKVKAEALMAELATKPSREEAAKFLASLAPSKGVLTEAAKMREVHVVKQDTLKAISEKLVENVVGSRLDSVRIRGIEKQVG